MLKITIQPNMIDIDHNLFTYSNMRGLYGVRNGQGIQVESELKEDIYKIKEVCAEISNKIYELQLLLGDLK